MREYLTNYWHSITIIGINICAVLKFGSHIKFNTHKNLILLNLDIVIRHKFVYRYILSSHIGCKV